MYLLRVVAELRIGRRFGGEPGYLPHLSSLGERDHFLPGADPFCRARGTLFACGQQRRVTFEREVLCSQSESVSDRGATSPRAGMR